jgi:hypothetical protein
MKKLLLPAIIGLIISCITSKKTSSFLNEDEMFITRKYIGDFVDYQYTGPQSFGGPQLFWIKTSLDTAFIKISVYGKNCEFSVGDRIYLRRTYSTSGVFGYWYYQVENDSFIYYKVSSFEDDDKVLVQSLF